VPRGESKAARLSAWIGEHRPSRVGDRELASIRAALAPVSENHLRKLLLASGVPLDVLVAGVIQEDYETLERTLRALSSEYTGEDQDRARTARQRVLTGKEHARWALKRLADDAEAVAVKREMLLWMQTWLENPALFPDWVALRKRLLNLD
jgi:hypothetical protein